MAIAELDQTIRELSVDPDRVYLTGFSMGAIGAYGLAFRWPDRVAALVAIAGRVESASTSGIDEAARRANRFVTAADPFRRARREHQDSADLDLSRRRR